MNEFRLLTIFLILLVFSGCQARERESAAFFCPSENCEERTILAIKNAKTSVHAAIYSFTSDEIAQALNEAAKNGVDTRLVTDYLQSKSNASALAKLGPEVKARVADSGKTMHNKFLVIDGEIVLTGSYNWTKNGDESNSENLAFIFGKETAEDYEKEFLRLWVEAG